MVEFGDADPEDAYSADDPPAERYRILRLVVASILLAEARGDSDRDRLFERVQAARWAVGVFAGEHRSYRKRLSIFSLWLDEVLSRMVP